MTFLDLVLCKEHTGSSTSAQSTNRRLSISTEDTCSIASVLLQMSTPTSPDLKKMNSINMTSPTLSTGTVSVGSPRLPSFSKLLSELEKPSTTGSTGSPKCTSYPLTPPTPNLKEPDQISTIGITSHKQNSLVKYDTLKNGTKIIRKCTDCQSSHTSGHWCQDPYVINGYICQKCYRRRRRHLKSSGSQVRPVRRCWECKGSDSSLWFLNTTPNTFLCFKCHDDKEREGSVKKCFGCGSMKSSKWGVDGSGNNVCRKCSRQFINQ